MIRPGQIIKHIRFLDVCFEVLSVFTAHNRIKIKGYWLNMGFVESYQIFSRPDRIEIMNTDIDNWRISYGNEINPKCHRYDKWRNA